MIEYLILTLIAMVLVYIGNYLTRKHCDLGFMIGFVLGEVGALIVHWLISVGFLE